VIDQNDWNGNEEHPSYKEDWVVINVGFISFQMDSFVQVSKLIFELFRVEPFLIVSEKDNENNN